MPGFFSDKRNYLIFGVCLPFAVLLGYHLADIDDPVSRLVFAAAIAGLSFPTLIRWYHPLLIVSWNMTAQVAFLPGAPLLWAFLSLVGLLFAVLNRAVNPGNRFTHVPSLTLPMVAFACVVLATAKMTGGINISSLGASATQGGRKYFYVIAAIVGFFALSSRTISPKNTHLFVALFFLPGLTSVIGRVALWLGPAANVVYRFFPGEMPGDQFATLQSDAFGEVRITGIAVASFAVFSWMLARYGIRGVFDLARPWRVALFFGVIAAGFLGGFRSHLILVMLTFGILFLVEGMWRTRVMLFVCFIGALLGVVLVTSADKLPPTIQRCFSFLPIEIDPMIRMQAESSSQWRINMWEQVVDEVPVYFFIGKGYNFAADENYMAQFNQLRFGAQTSADWAAVAGDYHNGPLSLLIPFGIFGLLGFIWLVVAGLLYLYKTYRYGLPELRIINAFLFASFLARSIFFFTIFGAISFELYVFTGILGLSIALNARKSADLPPEGELAVQT